MTPSGGHLLIKIAVAAAAVIVACEAVAALLAAYRTELCVLVLLAIIARLVWYYTERW